MIELYVKGQKVDMPNNYNIGFTLDNPVFQKSGIHREYTNNFTLESTPNNNEIFQFMHRLDSILDVDEMQASIYIAGLPFREGYLRFKKGSNKKITAYFTTVRKDIEGAWANKKIGDEYFYHGEFNLPVTGASANLKFIIQAPTPISSTFILDITINETNIYAEYDPGDGWTEISIASDVQTRINNEFTGMVSLATISSYPAIELDLVSHDFPDIQAKVNDGVSFFSVLEYANTFSTEAPAEVNTFWQDYLTDNAPYPIGDDFVFFPIQADNAYGDDQENELHNLFINPIFLEAGVYPVNTDANVDGKFHYTIAPQMSYKLIFENLLGAIGLSVSGPFSSSKLYTDTYLFNNKTLDKLIHYYPEVPHDPALDGSLINIYKTKFSYNDMLADITVADFMKALRNTVGAYYIYKDNTIEIHTIKDMLSSNPKRWEGIIQEDYTFDTILQNGYKIYYNLEDELEDEFIRFSQLEDITDGDEEIDIEIGMDTLHIFETYRGDKLRFPIWGGAVNSTEFVGTDNEMPLAWLIYHGFLDGYHYASHDDKDTTGTTTIVDVSLDTEVIFETYWKQYVEIMERHKLISIEANLGIEHLAAFEWATPLRSFDHPSGSTTIIPTRLKFNVTPSTITRTRVTGITI